MIGGVFMSYFIHERKAVKKCTTYVSRPFPSYNTTMARLRHPFDGTMQMLAINFAVFHEEHGKCFFTLLFGVALPQVAYFL